MKPFAVALTGRAISDLQAIRSYIEADDHRAAASVAKRLVEAIDSLKVLPHRGRPGRGVQTRELVIPGWPWIIVYEVASGRVTVLRVLHAAQGRRAP